MAYCIVCTVMLLCPLALVHSAVDSDQRWLEALIAKRMPFYRNLFKGFDDKELKIVMDYMKDLRSMHSFDKLDWLMYSTIAKHPLMAVKFQQYVFDKLDEISPEALAFTMIIKEKYSDYADYEAEYGGVDRTKNILLKTLEYVCREYHKGSPRIRYSILRTYPFEAALNAAAEFASPPNRFKNVSSIDLMSF